MSWVQQLCSLADTYVSRSHHLHAHARRGAGAPGGYAPCVCWPPRLAGLEVQGYPAIVFVPSGSTAVDAVSFDLGDRTADNLALFVAANAPSFTKK